MGNRPQHDRLHWQSTAITSLVLSLALIFVAWGMLSAVQIWSLRYGFLACCGMALLAAMLRSVTPYAALTGAILSFSLFLWVFAFPIVNQPWWRTSLVPLLTLFVLTHLATKLGSDNKSKADEAQSERGRNAAQVAANIGVASLVMPVVLSPKWFLESGGQGWRLAGAAILPAMVAALAEAAADTVSSEIGQAVGGEPRMLTTWREVPAGTDGAISFKGTLAGLAAGLFIVLVSMKVLQMSSRIGIFAFGGAVFGLFFDSLLGATLERRGWINNDAVNFLSTLAAAIFAGSAGVLSAWINV